MSAPRPSRRADPPDVVVIGDCNPDLVLRGDVVPAWGQAERLVDEARLTIGGSAAIVAAGVARLGLSCRLLAVVGADALADVQLTALTRRAVDVSGVVVDQARPTGVSVILSRGDDRAILTSLGTIAAMRAALIDPALLADVRHVHVSSYYLQTELAADLADVLATVHAGGATTSLDTNWDPAERWDGGLEKVLRHIDWFLPNGEEACRISGEPTPDLAAEMLSRHVDTVVVKLGAQGAIARRREEVVRRPALPVAGVDATGAGDSFTAGFIAGELAGWPLGDALMLACVCGSLSTRAMGGVDGQPTFDEALDAMPREPAVHDRRALP